MIAISTAAAATALARNKLRLASAGKFRLAGAEKGLKGVAGGGAAAAVLVGRGRRQAVGMAGTERAQQRQRRGTD